MMKKIVSLLLALMLAVSLFGCAQSMTPVENFLIALKKMDFISMKSALAADEQAGSLYFQIEDYENSLTDEEKATLAALYSLVQYTMGEESGVRKGEKTVSITLKVPNMARIQSLADTKMMVSAESPSQIIGAMLSEGVIESGYMTEVVVSVKMIETDGVWLLPYSEMDNGALVSALAVSEMLRFFAIN